MTENKLPDGWDEAKVRRVPAHYDGQTEDEAVQEDEAGFRATETVMSVPHELVSEVRDLIAKHQR